jgi:hypothetical protein
MLPKKYFLWKNKNDHKRPICGWVFCHRWFIWLWLQSQWKLTKILNTKKTQTLLKEGDLHVGIIIGFYLFEINSYQFLFLFICKFLPFWINNSCENSTNPSSLLCQSYNFQILINYLMQFSIIWCHLKIRKQPICEVKKQFYELHNVLLVLWVVRSMIIFMWMGAFISY